MHIWLQGGSRHTAFNLRENEEEPKSAVNVTLVNLTFVILVYIKLIDLT